MDMNRFREKKLFWLIVCYGLISLIFSVNCFADEADVGFNSYPELPDLSSDRAVPDLFTGTMNYAIPIKAPPGRNGMSPNIALTYRSSNGNGPIGMGWEIEMGAIQRSTRGGVD
ncbi:SpvB/TcaC N-terminal domain-containing protein [Geotalea uraniireducens]|uniref:SpvB/TcaC N-terminal domain-containing protein n=1 Tax=Geotalea uraniireducens TaxID=351604 RepID=UPI00059DD7DA|nr:SpvB/TcaC N-terminal domain-containing protein [Geotalea uraniireducens]